MSILDISSLSPADSATLSAAVDAASVANGGISATLGIRSTSNIGFRTLCGLIAQNQAIDTTGRTFEVMLGTAAPFDAVQIILAVSQTAALDAITPNVSVSVASVPDMTDASLAAATWTQATFGGSLATTTTLPPALNSDRRSFVTFNWTPNAAIARTDGFAGAILVARVFVQGAASGNIVIQGGGGISLTNWISHPSGRVWRMISKGGGNFASSNQTSMNFANSAVANGTPILAVRYLARGKVINLGGYGDSITEGQTGTYFGAGPGFATAVALSANAQGVAYEWSDLGWSGQSMSKIMNNALDAAANGMVPNIAFLPNGSPNNYISSPTITTANIASMRGQFATAWAALAAKGVEVIPWTWLPSSTAQHAYGATDALRRSYNADVLTYASRGVVVVDASKALSGSDDGTGQIQLIDTNDGLHPNDTGYALLTPLYTAAVKRVVVPIAGSLVTP